MADRGASRARSRVIALRANASPAGPHRRRAVSSIARSTPAAACGAACL